MFKIKLTALIMAIILLLSFTSCSSSTSTTPSGMQIASSDDVDYVLYVPENWKVDKSTLYASAYYSSGDATSISATAYAIGNIEDTVDSWWETFYKQFESVYSDASEVTKEESKLGNLDATKFSFSGKLNDQEYKYIIVAVLHNYYIYYVTFTSTPEYYDNHLEDLDSVLSYFEFLK